MANKIKVYLESVEKPVEAQADMPQVGVLVGRQLLGADVPGMLGQMRPWCPRTEW